MNASTNGFYKLSELPPSDAEMKYLAIQSVALGGVIVLLWFILRWIGL